MKCYHLLMISCIISCLFFPGCTNKHSESCQIVITSQSDYTEVILSNQYITARYTSHNPSALANLFINNGMHDVAGGTNWKYLDGIESSGSIKHARMIERQDTLETVELHWENHSESHITIFRSLPLLKIDYFINSGKITDVGATRGTNNGMIAVYGSPQGYTVEENDSISFIDYRGFFIGGVFNSLTGNGFGRILPCNIYENKFDVIYNSGGLKYSIADDPDNDIHITSFIYTFSEGKDEMIIRGKSIVDWYLDAKISSLHHLSKGGH